jgi:hypothetical protein
MDRPEPVKGKTVWMNYAKKLEAERDNAREAKKAFKELCREHTKTITELEVERDKLRDAAQAVVDSRRSDAGHLITVEGEKLLALKATLEV